MLILRTLPAPAGPITRTPNLLIVKRLLSVDLFEAEKSEASEPAHRKAAEVHMGVSGKTLCGTNRVLSKRNSSRLSKKLKKKIMRFGYMIQ